MGSDINDTTVRSRNSYVEGKLDGTRKKALIEKEELMRGYFNIKADLRSLKDSINMCKNNVSNIKVKMEACKITQTKVIRYEGFMERALQRKGKADGDKAIKISPGDLTRILNDENVAQRRLGDSEHPEPPRKRTADSEHPDPPREKRRTLANKENNAGISGNDIFTYNI